MDEFSFSGDIYARLMTEYESSIPKIEKMVLCFSDNETNIVCYEKLRDNPINKAFNILWFQ